MPTARTTYLAGSTGRWSIDSITPVSGVEDLVARLRGAPEWGYVDREVDVRLSRDSGDPAP